MTYPALFVQSQLEIACGGADKLLQLADRAYKTGSLASAQCQAFITEVHSAAEGELNAILQVAYDPADPTYQGAGFVQQLAVTLGVYWAWHKSTGGIAVPPEVKDARTEAIASLDKAREGMKSLGTSTAPTSNEGVKEITVDSTGTRVLRGNMGGFC